MGACRATGRATASAGGRAWRLFWWIAFPPIGIWLSYRHGQRRRTRLIVNAMASVDQTIRAENAERHRADAHLAAMQAANARVRNIAQPCPGC
jgi:hypothetical protein